MREGQDLIKQMSALSMSLNKRMAELEARVEELEEKAKPGKPGRPRKEDTTDSTT